MSKRKTDKRIKSICFCAMFAALTCVCTFISLPLPIGYFNLGDTIVLTGAWLLGPLWGTIAAAIGSSLADILMGFAIYAPATAVIKGLMAVVACLVLSPLKKIIKKGSFEIIVRGISAIASEILMVLGYLLYDATVMGYGAGALVSVAGNAMQGVVGVCGALILFTAMRASHATKLFFVSED